MQNPFHTILGNILFIMIGLCMISNYQVFYSHIG